MAKLKFPDDATGALRELMVALHELHQLASWPSTRLIARDVVEQAKHDRVLGYLREPKTGNTTVHRLFTDIEKLPELGYLLDVVTVLCKRLPRCYRADLDTMLGHFAGLWQRALDERVPALPGSSRPGFAVEPGSSRPGFAVEPGSWRDDDGDDGFGPLPISGAPRPRPLSGGDGARPTPDGQAPTETAPTETARTHAARTDAAPTDRAAALAAVTPAQPRAGTLRDLYLKLAIIRDIVGGTMVVHLAATAVREVESGEVYFLAADAELDSVGRWWNALPYRDIQFAVANSGADRVVIVVDAIDGGFAEVADPEKHPRTLSRPWAGPTAVASARPVSVVFYQRGPGDPPIEDWLAQIDDGGLTMAEMGERLRALAVSPGRRAPQIVDYGGGGDIVLDLPHVIDGTVLSVSVTEDPSGGASR